MAEIWAYVAQFGSEVSATKLLATIENAWAPLRHFPLSGVARDQLALGLRAIFVDNYAIYYMHRVAEVLIVRVLHGARDAAAVANQGGFEAR